MPVNCGGQVVHPGDILVGDLDGVVIIRPSDAASVLEKALKHNDMERDMFERIEAGTLDRAWVDELLTQKGCEIAH